MFKFFLYRLGLFLIDRLPVRLVYGFALFVSDMQYFLSFRDRHAVRNNLKKILPDSADVSFLTREVFRNFGRYLIEFFRMKEMVNGAFIQEKIRKHGIEYLDDALLKGKGGIIVTAHIGNWELGGVLLSQLGYPVMAIALPHKERPVNDLFNLQRENKGVTVVPINGAFRRCVEQIKKNQFVAIVADRDFGMRGVVMDFLGQRVVVPKGAALLSLKTEAPIIPAFLIRNDDGSFDMSCHPPIYPPEGSAPADEETIIQGMMARYLSVIEDQIRAYPSQWLLFREFSA